MTIYMFAETASNSPIRMKSMEVFTSIEYLGKKIIKIFTEEPKGSMWNLSNNLKEFVELKYSFKIYIFEADSSAPGKIMSGKKVWKAMEKEDSLKRDIMKTMLRVN